MNQNKNPYQNMIIEFHILQSFPVTCLNRDDVGAPKTAMVGGALRARVSSQCWKRYVRIAMHELGGIVGTRTKFISPLIAKGCEALGANAEQAKACGDKIEQIFIKKSEDKKGKKLASFETHDSAIALEPNWLQGRGNINLLIRTLRPGASRPGASVLVELNSKGVTGISHQD